MVLFMPEYCLGRLWQYLLESQRNPQVFPANSIWNFCISHSLIQLFIPSHPYHFQMKSCICMFCADRTFPGLSMSDLSPEVYFILLGIPRFFKTTLVTAPCCLSLEIDSKCLISPANSESDLIIMGFLIHTDVKHPLYSLTVQWVTFLSVADVAP